MNNQAALASDKKIVTGLATNHQEPVQTAGLSGHGGSDSRPRPISADAFRMLTARLKKTSFAPQHEPATNVPAQPHGTEPTVPSALITVQSPVAENRGFDVSARQSANQAANALAMAHPEAAQNDHYSAPQTPANSFENLPHADQPKLNQALPEETGLDVATPAPQPQQDAHPARVTPSVTVADPEWQPVPEAQTEPESMAAMIRTLDVSSREPELVSPSFFDMDTMTLHLPGANLEAFQKKQNHTQDHIAVAHPAVKPAMAAHLTAQGDQPHAIAQPAADNENDTAAQPLAREQSATAAIQSHLLVDETNSTPPEGAGTSSYEQGRVALPHAQPNSAPAELATVAYQSQQPEVLHNSAAEQQAQCVSESPAPTVLTDMASEAHHALASEDPSSSKLKGNPRLDVDQQPSAMLPSVVNNDRENVASTGPADAPPAQHISPSPEAQPTATAPASQPHALEVEGIGEITRAIYMVPTPAERAAFLAEMAALAEAEAREEQARIQAEKAEKAKVMVIAPAASAVKPENDPFAKIISYDDSDLQNINSDDDAGELARSLLDMMLSGPSSGLPQERTLAADALLKLIPRVPLKPLMSIVERLSVMENPPHLLTARLITDPRPEISGPLLEFCNHIGDEILLRTIATGHVNLQRMIARRRRLSTAITDQLIGFDDPSVILTLIRNSGAIFTHLGFMQLANHAARNQGALAPLATRADLPAPVAFELFWSVPAELRRYLLSRFLTDSETLTKILKITHVVQGGEHGKENKFPTAERVALFARLLEAGEFEEAAIEMAAIAGINSESALRIISDKSGEPLAITMKALGVPRAYFEAFIERLRISEFSIISVDRQTQELQSIFDSMSFNKARVLLTYWDWAVLKSGPYAPVN